MRNSDIFINFNDPDGIGLDAGQNLKIFIGGDWSPSISNNAHFLLETGDFFYGDLIHRIKDADLSVLNVETVISSRKLERHKSGPSAIGESVLAKHLSDCGFDLACLANNHILDAGAQGLEETINILLKHGVDVLGAGCSLDQIYNVKTYQKGAEKISVINVSDGIESNEKFNNGSGAADLESWRVADLIQKSKRNNEIVVVISHAGAEFLPIPTPRIRRLYREFIDLGADLVVGHHPHVVQGLELYRGQPIFYSLGNFGICRDFRRKSEEIGFVLEVEISGRQLQEIRILPIKNTQKGVLFLPKSSQEDFLHFWTPANELLDDKEQYNLVWEGYISRYKLFSKIFDIAWEVIIDPARARLLFNNLLLDNCFREHVSGGFDNCGANTSSENKFLERWDTYRTRKLGSRIFSRVVESSAKLKNFLLKIRKFQA
ncbi:CapA family protein [Gammaproteobacteria bacterium]|nr:CapA family protein [Gammaproteobacteria bacterium]